MEYISIPGLDKEVSRIGLGTWSMGGAAWGGADDALSLQTIRVALDSGINLLDTAPVYGEGHSEELVGRAVADYGKRDQVVIATKVGVAMNPGGSPRNSSPERIRKEIEESLRRLRTEYIDLYQIHWPDTRTPFEVTAEALVGLQTEGKIRAIGLSNFSLEQMERFRSHATVATIQPPYNLFEQDAGLTVIPAAHAHGIAVLAYSALCRGLLSGRMNAGTVFQGDDLRKNADPKYQPGRFEQYLQAVSALDSLARSRFGKTVMQLAVRWILDQGVEVALVGARKPEQIQPFPGVMGWKIDAETNLEIDAILTSTIEDPCPPDFMRPPD